jgi:hypothetical protein
MGMKYLTKRARKIAARMQIDNFALSHGWISRIKDHHGLMYKKLAARSMAINTNMTGLWLDRPTMLLEG